MSKKKSKNDTNPNLQQETILQAVVIADSFNKRFYPVTLRRPRCLFPLANQPLLSYTLEFLSSNNVKQIYIYCCHCSEMIKDYLAESKWTKESSPCQVITIVSQDFSSIGDVLRDVDQKSLFENDFILVPGDVVSNIQLQQSLEEHNMRRQKDKNGPLLTLLLQPSSPTHRARSIEDDLVIACDVKTNRILYYNKVVAEERKISFPLSIFHHPEVDVELRYDMCDTGIWICSPQVPQLCTDNFDYQTQLDFIKGILINEEFLGNQIHMSAAGLAGYCSRIHNFRLYDVVSRDVVMRWAYPFVPEAGDDSPPPPAATSPSFSQSASSNMGYRLLRHNVYLHHTCVLGQASTVDNNSMVGVRTTIGTGCDITNSIIGDDCIIEDGCSVRDSYVWNNVTISAGCKVEKCLVCDNVTVGENCTLGEGCILCDEVRIGKCVQLETGTVIHRYLMHEGDLSDDEMNTTRAFDVATIGDDGRGFVWRPGSNREGDDSDRSESSESYDDQLARGIWGLSLQDRRRQFDSETDETDTDEELADDDDDVMNDDVGSESDGVEKDDDFACFQREVSDSLQRGIDENVGCDNIVLEINSSKYAYNMTVGDVVQTLTRVVVDLAHVRFSSDSTATQPAHFFVILKKILEYASPVLANYNKTEQSQLDCLRAFEKCAKSREHVANSLIKILMYLYEEDVLSEEAIVTWFQSTDGSAASNSIRAKVSKFVQWLNEAEEEESDDDDD